MISSSIPASLARAMKGIAGPQESDPPAEPNQAGADPANVHRENTMLPIERVDHESRLRGSPVDGPAPRSMSSVKTCRLPDNALLGRYRNSLAPELAGAYTDCYFVTVTGDVALADFVYAFYTTWVFKLERVILKYLANRPSTDVQARALADGQSTAFAAWDVEDRNENQLLMCDLNQRTRSWFMVDSDEAQTTLFFGSAITPIENREQNRYELGAGFDMLLGLHKLYSRVLLRVARTRLG